MKSIIFILGKTASGKTTLAKKLLNKYPKKYFHIEASEILSKLIIDNNLFDIKKRPIQIFKVISKNSISKYIIENYDITDDKILLITGLRQLEEITYFIDLDINLRFIFIDVNFITRFVRFFFRERRGIIKSFSIFIIKEYYDYKLGINKIKRFLNIVEKGSVTKGDNQNFKSCHKLF